VPESHEVVIVGSGFAGLGMAIELKRSGREDFVVLERDTALGGTWLANHYPGCACDVPTPYYSYSFAPKADWSRFYAPHDEIRAYLDDCAERFGIRPHLRTATTVTALRWDEDEQAWWVEVDGGPALKAALVVAAPGALSRPAYPDVEGLGDFAGPWFHSAEWDHSVDLTGARVAVIGTGASAIQFVPRLARHASRVEVFQRTAPWVLPKPDRRIPKAEQWLYRRAPLAQRAVRGAVWAIQEWMGLGNTVDQRLTRPLEAIGRATIRRSIKDPELRARLTPDYAIGCKRLLLANDWYPTLALEHVELVSDRIVRASERGLLTADGTEHPADAIVFGTGFHATEPLAELTVAGRGGLELTERWCEGMSAHRGTTVSGFPNFFLMPGPNTGTGHTSQVFMIEAQIRHALAAIERMRDRGAAVIEPRAEAQEAFNADLQERMRRTVWLRGGCSSWYLDARGRNTTLWPGSSLAFRRALREIDDREFHFEPPRRPRAVPTPLTEEKVA
jgi:cation diffusion facilitator CzcD-associated flavoprotein CzcO